MNQQDCIGLIGRCTNEEYLKEVLSAGDYPTLRRTVIQICALDDQRKTKLADENAHILNRDGAKIEFLEIKLAAVRRLASYYHYSEQMIREQVAFKSGVWAKAQGVNQDMLSQLSTVISQPIIKPPPPPRPPPPPPRLPSSPPRYTPETSTITVDERSDELSIENDFLEDDHTVESDVMSVDPVASTVKKLGSKLQSIFSFKEQVEGLQRVLEEARADLLRAKAKRDWSGWFWGFPDKQRAVDRAQYDVTRWTGAKGVYDQEMTHLNDLKRQIDKEELTAEQRGLLIAKRNAVESTIDALIEGWEHKAGEKAAPAGDVMYMERGCLSGFTDQLLLRVDLLETIGQMSPMDTGESRAVVRRNSANTHYHLGVAVTPDKVICSTKSYGEYQAVLVQDHRGNVEDRSSVDCSTRDYSKYTFEQNLETAMKQAMMALTQYQKGDDPIEVTGWDSAQVKRVHAALLYLKDAHPMLRDVEVKSNYGPEAGLFYGKDVKNYLHKYLLIEAKAEHLTDVMLQQKADLKEAKMAQVAEPKKKDDPAAGDVLTGSKRYG